MKLDYEYISQFLYRLSIAALFAYFGILAILDPATQAGIWVRPEFSKIITSIVSISFFMRILGALQIFVAIFLATRIFYLWGLALALILLAGIIINLGLNDIALRDAVTFAGVLYLCAQELSRQKKLPFFHNSKSDG